SVTVTNASATPDPNKPGATGSVSSFTVNGSQVTVNLTGVSNAQKLTINLSNVSDGVNTNTAFMLPIGVLLGDTSGDGTVNAADITQTRRQSGNVAHGDPAANFREDVTVDGVINAADISAVRKQCGYA